MLDRIISTAGFSNPLLVFAVGLICAYQQTMYIREWFEDHAKSKGFLERQMLSAVALFSVSLTERCRRRRGKLLLWTSAFVFLPAAEVLLVWL